MAFIIQSNSMELHTKKSVDSKFIGFSAVAFVLGAGLAMAVSASADTGVFTRWGGERAGCDPERRTAIEAALEAGDYDAWKELMGGKGRVSEVVTEENFTTFVAMHEAVENGDFEKAKELRKELGLGWRQQDGQGFQRGMGMMRHGGNW